MPLTRIYEENEIGPDLRRTFADIRSSLNLPFVPTLFKLCVAHPQYLRALWDDLAPVARSREFYAATKALDEFTHSQMVSGGWRFPDQRQVLAGLKFSSLDVESMGMTISIIQRALLQMALFSRLLQRGYSGGQKGRVTSGKQAAASSRLLTLHVPNEKEAGLRVWLIYSDIRKHTGARNVLSLFRVLSPYPAYLASVWTESKKLLGEPAFLRARDEVARRTAGLLSGMPVKDHRATIKDLTPAHWNELEEMVDGMTRLFPQFALLSAVWQRSFPRGAGKSLAA